MKLKHFFQILTYCRKLESKFIPLGIISKIAASIKPFLVLIMSKILIDSVLQQQDYKTLFQSILLLIILYFILSVVEGYSSKHYEYHFKNFKRKHDMIKAAHLLEINYEWTENDEVQEKIAELYNLETKIVFGFHSFGDYVSKTFGSISGMILAICILTGAFRTTTNIGKIPALVFHSGFLVLFIGLFILTLVIVAKINEWFASIIGSKSANNVRYLRSYNQIIFNYKSAKDIRLYCEELLKNYSEKYRSYTEETFSLLSDLFTKTVSIETFFSTLTLGTVFFFVGMKALYRAIPMSEVLLYIGAFQQLTILAMELIDAVSCLISSDLYRAKLIDYYNIGKKSKENHRLSHKQDEIPNSVGSVRYEMKNVSFSYPGNDKKVLKNINFSIYPGEKIAVVGENGSGKTTLIKVLLGLYTNYSGKITINDQDIKNFDPVSYKDLFSPVFQDFKLLGIRLRENISAFKEKKEEDIKTALEDVGMKEFYQKHGLNTYLTREFDTEGIEISGGESQKLAMARAINKTSDIFILDEPTAALDPISEYEIYSHFNQITKGKTSLFISHRLSSCKFCDRIIVIDNGEIVQTGTHEDLLSQKTGKYYELWNSQAKYYQR